MAITVSSTFDNGVYTAGDFLYVYAQFSEYIIVTGSPRLLLDTGDTNRYATYISFDANRVFFRYDVMSGDVAADLDYVATNSLELNGGTIKNFAGSDMSLTLPSPGASGSLSANKNIEIAWLLWTDGNRTREINGIEISQTVELVYSRYAYDSLPTDNSNLTTIYSDSDIIAVATVDGIFASQSASNQYAIHEFKNNASGKSSCTVTWTGQNSSGNTVGYPTILEIYNTNTNLWEELDRDASAAADTNFTLSFPILSGLDNYKDDNGFITCRVYQSSIGR